MAKRIAGFFRSDLGLLVLFAAARTTLHIATNGEYGFHRDELQTLDDARHLDWGFVAYPPITPLIGRLELILFGASLVGFRVFSAMAVSMIMVLAGLIAKELGGDRHVQVLVQVVRGDHSVLKTILLGVRYVAASSLTRGLPLIRTGTGQPSSQLVINPRLHLLTVRRPPNQFCQRLPTPRMRSVALANPARVPSGNSNKKR